jgi:hypothetical protein
MPGADGKPRNLHVIADKFGKESTASACASSATNITAIPMIRDSR